MLHMYTVCQSTIKPESADHDRTEYKGPLISYYATRLVQEPLCLPCKLHQNTLISILMSEYPSTLVGGVAVITGGGGGLGSALAMKVGTVMKMKVIVADIAFESAKEVASHINSIGGYAEAAAVDVSKADDVQKLADDVFSNHGSVQLLINNAGIETLGFCWEVSSQTWDKTFTVNAAGVASGVRAFLPRMLKSGKECWVVNVSSLGAISFLPSQTVYVASKAAVQAFTEGLYTELKLINAPVHVSAVLPGLLRTDIFQSAGRSGVENARGSVQKFREHLGRLADEKGMDLRTAANMIMEQVVAGRFWVTTHPELTQDCIERRVQFLGALESPELAPGTMTVLDFK